MHSAIPSPARVSPGSLFSSPPSLPISPDAGRAAARADLRGGHLGVAGVDPLDPRWIRLAGDGELLIPSLLPLFYVRPRSLILLGLGHQRRRRISYGLEARVSEDRCSASLSGRCPRKLVWTMTVPSARYPTPPFPFPFRS